MADAIRINVTTPPPINIRVTEAVLVLPGGGSGGSGGYEYVQSTPLATWTITHGLGRRPGVAVYIGGELVDTDVVATATQVTIIFPSPMSGTAVLT